MTTKTRKATAKNSRREFLKGGAVVAAASAATLAVPNMVRAQSANSPAEQKGMNSELREANRTRNAINRSLSVTSRRPVPSGMKAIGVWLIDFWIWQLDHGRPTPTPGSTNPGRLKKLVKFDMGDHLYVYFDRPNRINVNIPYCPYTKAELLRIRNGRDAINNQKKINLGYAIMGGCRR